MPVILIILGLTGLWWGTKWIINGALGIARRYNLSHSFVGVAILAVGTDLPEVFVSLDASLLHLRGIETSGIITGNAIGSCISQITFILGTAGLFLTFKVPGRDILRDIVALPLSISLLFIFGLNGIITRWEGAILIFVYCLYYILLIKNKNGHSEGESHGEQYTFITHAVFLLLGLVILVFSSHIVVESAMELAEQWNVAQSFIGIAIIGFGTSLPELAVSVGAAIRQSPGLSVGNIIGSNVFDGLIPVGLGGVISTTNVEPDLLIYDLPLLLLATVLALLFLISKNGISKKEGIILIGVFLLYLIAKFLIFESSL